MPVPSQGWRVMEIAKDRVVMEVPAERGMETVIFRFEGGKQTVQRLKKSADGQRSLYQQKEWPEEMGSQ